MPEKTIFLSHSSKDIDKVRKIRDVLETLEYEPLLFHMKCLDDDNEVLEDFIKKEIDARNVFVYCKSKNAEASAWVQKEVSYIKESSDKRLYEIDIEKPLRETLVSFLYTLADIIKQNSIFISCSHADKSICDTVSTALANSGYEIIRYNCYSHQQYVQHDDDIEAISRNGIFVPIITVNFLNSPYCMSEIEKVLYHADSRNVMFKPIYVNVSQAIAERLLPTAAQRYNGYTVNDHTLTDPNEMHTLLRFLCDDNLK